MLAHGNTDYLLLDINILLRDDACNITTLMMLLFLCEGIGDCIFSVV